MEESAAQLTDLASRAPGAKDTFSDWSFLGKACHGKSIRSCALNASTVFQSYANDRLDAWLYTTFFCDTFMGTDTANGCLPRRYVELGASDGTTASNTKLLERELHAVGLRLNERPPNVYYKRKATGGVMVSATCKLENITEKDVQQVLHEYRIHSAEVLFREDCTVDQFIDLVEGNRKYVRCLNVYNKVDMTSIEEVGRISRQPDCLVLSCQMKLNCDIFLDKIWEYLGLVRVYTKPRGKKPDWDDPLILTDGRHGTTVESACRQLHRSLIDTFDYAMVWGASVKHAPQRVGLSHGLADEDVIQIVKKRTMAGDPNNEKKGPANQSRAQIKKAKKPLKT